MAFNIMMTGTDGMIGSRLANYLEKQGHRVRRFDPLPADVTDPAEWTKHEYPWDFVIHLAALAGVRPSFDDPETYYKSNVLGTHEMFKFARKCGSKVLYASSSNAYEWWGNPYAATKMMNEVQAFNEEAIGMRFHTVWPGRDDMLFKKLQKGEVEYINKNHYRDFIHVADLIEAINLLLNNFDDVHKKTKVVDIGTGENISVAAVAKAMGFMGQYRDENPQGERESTKADISVLTSLGWKPKRNILNKGDHEDVS